MALVDMKQSKEEAAEVALPAGSDAEYPYGLRIHLTDEDLVKLGLTAMPPVGTPMSINAVAEVCSTSSYSDAEGEAENSLKLQIIAMEVVSGEAQQNNDSAAKALYG